MKQIGLDFQLAPSYKNRLSIGTQLSVQNAQNDKDRERAVSRKETCLVRWARELKGAYWEPTGLTQVCPRLLIILMESVSFSLKSEREL